MSSRWFVLMAASLMGAWGQSVVLQPATKVSLPTHIDGNTSAFWVGDTFHMFSSTGDPLMLSKGPNQFGPFESQAVDVTRQTHRPLWVEAAWRDADGTIYGWYHHEPGGVCPGSDLTAPKIGAVVSYDNGATVIDLGIVLESGDAPDCEAKNGFFATGHGDFSVVLDQERKYFYFFFTNYGGDVHEQGIVTARLAFEDRMHPAGAVKKYYQGEWFEPGIGGHLTPIYQAAVSWQREDTNSHWGPSVHWNTHLGRYVMLLNHACCEPGWPQEGIYASISYELEHPYTWGPPVRVMNGDQIGSRPGFYPQVMGLEPGGTDTLAGEEARLYIMGSSSWTLRFVKAALAPVDPTEPTEPIDPVDPTEPTEPESPLPVDIKVKKKP